MATIKKVYRAPKWGVRPTDNTTILNHVWYVEKGESYDLVQFTINELVLPYFWRESLCVPVKWSDSKIDRVVKKYVKQITEKDVDNFRKFLQEGLTWGWD